MRAQDDDGPAITARVHGTFQDAAGGGGVLSGDMSIVRFEVREGKVIAIGEITGSLADSGGNILGQVNQELALPVLRVGSTCNQLRMELAAADAEVLKTAVHFDQEVAGFDSRERGMVPKALDALRQVQELLKTGPPSADALADALNKLALRGDRSGKGISVRPLTLPSPLSGARGSAPPRPAGAPDARFLRVGVGLAGRGLG